MADTSKSAYTSLDSGNQVGNSDLAAIERIREILNEFYPDVREAMLKYCLFVTEKDLEA